MGEGPEASALSAGREVVSAAQVMPHLVNQCSWHGRK
jgi:hypothetical protein